MEGLNEIEECYESLEFAQIDTRKEHVKSAFGITFQWLLGLDETHPTNHASPFLHWLFNHLEDSNAFWLSGKAGSGKSTLMKFLHDHPAFKGSLAHWVASKELSQLVVAGFYFYERGESVLQKSREGLLRALFHALLFQAPALKRIVLGPKVASGNSQQTFGQMTRAVYIWSWADLKNSLLRFMHHKPGDLGVYLFADGLDEYLSSEALKQGITHDDDDDRGQFTSAKSKGHREIADFFLELARYPNTKICLSSRPLTIFENRFGGFPYLKLEDLTSRDIELYVSETLHQANRSNGLTAGELGDIVRMTVNAASGVFLWVELVVEQLAGRLINGDRAKELKQWLHDTPEELVGTKGLYMRMLQDIAPLDRQQGRHFFEAVRCARHQISPFILSFSEDTREEVLQTPVRILADQELGTRLLQIQSRLKSRCAGLLELQQRPLERGGMDDAERPRIAAFTFSDQLKYETPLYIHNIAVVNYYHQTVKEFLQSRAVQRILTGSFSFDYTTLVQACVQRIKCLSYVLSTSHGNVELWAHLKDALFYAERAEVGTGKADTELLDHLDKVTEESFRATLQSPRGEEAMKEWWQARAFLSGRHHWTILELQEQGGKRYGWGDNFLSWAVQANLHRYLEAKMSAADYQKKPGRPLLAYAVAPRGLTTMQQYSNSYNDMFGNSNSSPATVRTLLEHGESPTEMYRGRTIWEYMWYSLLAHPGSVFLDMSAVLDIIRLMIEAGADPNARVMYEGRGERRRKTPWHRHSCLFAVLAKLDGPQTARLEVAKELAQRGAHFYMGEKVSIEQDQEMKWACPLVKDWPERDGPTDAEWEAWGDEIWVAERQMEDPDDFMRSRQ